MEPVTIMMESLQEMGRQVLAQGFGASSIDFEVTWWTGSLPLDIRKSRDKVVAAVKRALDEARIEIPFPYRTLTFKEPLRTLLTQDDQHEKTNPDRTSSLGEDGSS